MADFNSCRFWHAHEAWETIWLEERGSSREFLRGLIQLSAAYHHIQQGTLRGAVRLFTAAMRRLAPYQPEHGGIPTAALLEAAGRDLERISEVIRTCAPVQQRGTIARYELPMSAAELPKIVLQSGWEERLLESLGRRRS